MILRLRDFPETNCNGMNNIYFELFKMMVAFYESPVFPSRRGYGKLTK